MVRALIVLALVALASPSLGQIRFNFVPDDDFAAIPGAVAAMERAGNQWSAFIKNPVTVNFRLSLSRDLPVNVYANASPVMVYRDYNDVTGFLSGTGGAASLLPSYESLRAKLPPGFSLLPFVGMAKANLKALRYPGLEDFDPIDATLTFNANLNFDTDNRNGVGISTLDLESVGAHEVGHGLGIISVVGFVEYLKIQRFPGPVSPYLLDLYRFLRSDAPTTPEEFTSAVRFLDTGGDVVLDDLAALLAVSTGITGNGWDASHLKPGEYRAIMNPALAYERIARVTETDAQLARMLRYDVSLSTVANSPEPGSLLLVFFTLCLLGIKKRQNV